MRRSHGGRLPDALRHGQQQLPDGDWCWNKLTASGPASVLARFRDETFSPDGSANPQPDLCALDLNRVIPEPWAIPFHEALACRLWNGIYGALSFGLNLKELKPEQLTARLERTNEHKTCRELGTYIEAHTEDPLIVASYEAVYRHAGVAAERASFEWRLAHWRTPSNSSNRSCSCIVSDGDANGSQLSCYFRTLSAPPLYVYLKLIGDWPGLSFSSLDVHELMDEAHLCTPKDGGLACQRVHTSDVLQKMPAWS